MNDASARIAGLEAPDHPLLVANHDASAGREGLLFLSLRH
jgi:hypothetical protein